jgi:hypothetical protein
VAPSSSRGRRRVSPELDLNDVVPDRRSPIVELLPVGWSRDASSVDDDKMSASDLPLLPTIKSTSLRRLRFVVGVVC